MAEDNERLEWLEDARKYAFRAVARYLVGLGTPRSLACDRASEAVQEALLRVLPRDLTSITSKMHFCRYVTRAAINWATSEYGRKDVPVQLGEVDFPTRDNNSDDDTEACVEFLQNAMEALSQEDRDLLHLAYVEDWTLGQIAQAKKLTVNQVWYRLNQLKERLRYAVERQM